MERRARSACIAPDSLMRMMHFPEDTVGKLHPSERIGCVATPCASHTSALTEHAATPFALLLFTVFACVCPPLLLASGLTVAATPGGGPWDGVSSHRLEDEAELPTPGDAAAAVVKVIPADLAPWLLNLLIGSSQWPERAFRIWKCLEPGLGSILTPPRPRNHISPVLQRMRASFLSRLWMPMRPGTPLFSRHGAVNCSS